MGFIIGRWGGEQGTYVATHIIFEEMVGSQLAIFKRKFLQ